MTCASDDLDGFDMIEQEEQFAALLSYACDQHPEMVQPITKSDFDRMEALCDRIRQAEMRVFIGFKKARQRVMSNPENVRTMMALAEV